MLLGGELQIDAENSNFEIFESALYMKSERMPLTVTILNAIQIISFFEEMYHNFQNRAKYTFTIKKK